MINYRQRSRTWVLLIAIFVLFSAVRSWSQARATDEEIQLPDGYAYKQIYAPPLAALSGLISSHDGTVYVRHLGPGGEVRVSRVDADQGTLTRILTVPSWDVASVIVGGPGSSFFIQVGSQIRQVQPDGSYNLWSSTAPAAMPEYYTKDGRMLGIGQAGTALVQIMPDGSTITLLTGFSGIYDVIAAADGTIYISDFPSGRLVRLSPGGASDTLTTIIKDNTDLALDQADNLYINNASGFARVDLATGAKTPMLAPLAPCPAVQSPALVVFDNSGRTIFGSWVANALTWADFSTGDGGLLLSQPWANTAAAGIGPDDALYMAITGCGSAFPTQVARFTAAGQSEVFFDGLTGIVSGFALDGAGGFYVSLSTETSAGIYHVVSGSTTPALVPGTGGVDSGVLSVHPITGHLFAYRGGSPPPAGQVTIAEYTPAGEVLHQVQLPKAPLEFLMSFAPDGTLYAYASEADRFFTGPTVDRWILELDLVNGAATPVASVERDGCCPLGGFGVDYSGSIWWLLSPDSLLYQVTPPTAEVLFGSNLPVDAAYVNRTSQDDILLNMPEGLYRIWMPTSSERVQLVIDIVDRFLFYDVLNQGQARALTAKLQAIAAALERGQTAVALNNTHALLAQLRAYTQAGILSETQADLLIEAIDEHILDQA